MITELSPALHSTILNGGSCLTAYPLLVSAVIATKYDADCGYASIGVVDLCRTTGLSRPTIIRAIRAISASGEWAVERNVWHKSESEKSVREDNRYIPSESLLATTR